MITDDQADEYLRVVGSLLVSEADDRDWLLVIASAYARGFITDLNWNTPQGSILRDLIAKVYPEYLEWVNEENIDPTTFPPTERTP